MHCSRDEATQGTDESLPMLCPHLDAGIQLDLVGIQWQARACTCIMSRMGKIPEVGLCIACSSWNLEQQVRSEFQEAQLVFYILLQQKDLQ